MAIGLILGTGVAPVCRSDDWSECKTDFGSALLSTVRVGSRDVIVLLRHGTGANIPPHLINYRANLIALKNAGVQRVLATSAAGSLRSEIEPGSLAVLNDFIDFTRHRQATVFDQPADTVTHADFSVPYCPAVSSALVRAAGDVGVALAAPMTYVCVEGPRYESPAEVRMFAQWGGDVVGMTGVPEVTMARELKMCYGSLAIVSNYAAGLTTQSQSHEDVVNTVNSSLPDMWKVLERAIGTLQDLGDCTCVS